MKFAQKYLILISMALVVACGQKDEIKEKKEELDKLKQEAQSIKIQIKELEKEIATLSPEYADEMDKSTLVEVLPVQVKPFEHKIELRGAVESRKNSTLSAESMGNVSHLNVREGDQVAAGQVLLSLDASVLRNTIAELRTSLDLATTVYEKQASLWEKKIGTEMQYLQAKNNKESLEKKLATANAQLAMSSVKAPFTGTIDQVLIKEGEMVAPGRPLFKIVSLKDMYIKADVSERFIGSFKKGDSVEIHFPYTNKSYNSVVSAVSKVINDQNRTFSLEVKLANGNEELRPNQVAILKIKDYENRNAKVIPTEIIQRDNTGDFIYVVENKDGKLKAKKHHIKQGISYGYQTEVLEGLTGNETIIGKGYRDITDGSEIKKAKENFADLKQEETNGNK